MEQSPSADTNGRSGLLPCSQESVIEPYSESHESNPPHASLYGPFNSNRPSTPM
jgi:hypothetical protein